MTEMVVMPRAKAIPMSTTDRHASASSAGNRATWGSAASSAYPAPASSPLGEGSGSHEGEQEGERDGETR